MRLAGLACLMLAGCIPPKHSSDYSVPFARSYWATPESQRPALSSLTVEQLYSLNQYGRRAFHPWRTIAPQFACRGADAIPYLKSKITPQTVGSILEMLAWMRRMETNSPGNDADLMAKIEAAFVVLPRKLRKAYSWELFEIDPDTLANRDLYYEPGAAARLRAQYCGNASAAAGLDSSQRVN